MSNSVASAADMSSSVTTIPETRQLMYVFEVSLEIKEDEGKVSTVNKGELCFYCFYTNL